MFNISNIIKPLGLCVSVIHELFKLALVCTLEEQPEVNPTPISLLNDGLQEPGFPVCLSSGQDSYPGAIS